jgi:1-acyl-sn-glycerol-3-phosphate acyltransferase
MLDQVGRAYRGLATGFCFAVFGAGGLLIGTLVLPVLVLCVRNPERRRVMGKRVMHESFRFFVGLMRFVGVLRYRVRNLERLHRPGLLVVANHPSLIDVVFLISLLQRANCIVRGTLLRNPFTRYPILAADLIPNWEDGEALLDRCAVSLARGDCLVVFPEGSRSDAPDRMLRFQRGAAHIALRARTAFTPVVIRVGEHNLGRHDKWWRAPRERMSYELEVMEDIPVGPLLERGLELPTAARELTATLRHFFEEALETPCRPLMLSKAS